MSTIYKKIVSTKRHKNYEFTIERYDSAMEVADDCSKRKITDSSFTDQSRKSMDGWEGVKNYDEALDLLKNGYQPTVEKLKEKAKANVTGVHKRISFGNDVHGFAPVVPLAMKGVPQSMINMTMKPMKCKVVDVYYDITCSCGTSSSQIIENGQKLLGAILELERQGYRFNLYAVQGYNNDKSSDMLIVKIKSSDKPIDLKRISFPLTHTAFFRVIGFDWYSKFPKGKYRSGYGHAIPYEFEGDEKVELGKQLFGNNAIVIYGTDIKNNGEEHIKEVLTSNEKNKNR